MNIVEFQHIAKSYGAASVLRDINLTVETGDFMVVFGRPTSGKSVLVRLLTGLERPDQGQILLRGTDITYASPGERNIGYVPQSFALYPHLSVYANIAYPLKLAKAAKAETDAAVQRAAELLGISELLERRPDQLSGGQKQRVAIARGLVKQTNLYVLDDPLVGLDFKLRERLIDDLKRTQETLGVTFLYTTSDAVEAMMLASNIAVMDAGVIAEAGPPEKLYTTPMRVQSMRYVGFPQANFLDGTLLPGIEGPLIQTALFEMGMTCMTDVANFSEDGQSVTVGIRPEHIRIGENAPPDAIRTTAKVLLREDLGGEEIVYLNAQGVLLTTVLIGGDDVLTSVDIDQIILIWMKPSDMVFFVNDQRIGVGNAKI